MARDFTKDGSNYMTLGGDAIGPLVNGASAISMAAWGYPDSFAAGTNENRLFTFEIAGGNTGGTMAVGNSTGTFKLRLGGRSVSTDSFQNRNANTEVTTGSWHHFGGVLDFANDLITPYYEGVAENSGAVTFGNSTYTHGSTSSTDGIGKGVGDTILITDVQWDGRIAEVAVWAGDIGASGYAMLNKGFSPLLVRPDLLVAYWPLMGRYSPEIDLISGENATINGTIAQADHQRIIYPTRPQAINVPAVVAATGQPMAKRIQTVPFLGGSLRQRNF